MQVRTYLTELRSFGTSRSRPSSRRPLWARKAQSLLPQQQRGPGMQPALLVDMRAVVLQRGFQDGQ